ncbi:MAG: hypothetical protein WC378_20145, partial [Opitutaceae bacterium]
APVCPTSDLRHPTSLLASGIWHLASLVAAPPRYGYCVFRGYPRLIKRPSRGIDGLPAINPIFPL